jgi:hypothetical protein
MTSLASGMTASSWLAPGISETLSEARSRLSEATELVRKAELPIFNVDVFPPDGRPTRAAAPATSSTVFTISNEDSPQPKGATTDPPARPAGVKPSLADLRAAELRVSTLQSEVDETKLRALKKIRAQDGQLSELRLQLQQAEAQRRHLEAEKEQLLAAKLEAANAAAQATAAAKAAAAATAGAAATGEQLPGSGAAVLFSELAEVDVRGRGEGWARGFFPRPMNRSL